jgi:hypothetical protein
MHVKKQDPPLEENGVHWFGLCRGAVVSPESGDWDRSAPPAWLHLQRGMDTVSKNEVLLLGSPRELG